MKYIKHFPLLALMACLPSAFGGAFTVNDPFGVGPPDVVGANLQFDIQKGEFNFGSTSGTVKLYLNFGPDNASLAPFTLGSVVLSIGDLFISGPGYNYGIGVQSHAGGVTAGTLYQINNANGMLTAQQALNNPPFCATCYRPTEIVWLKDDGAGSVTSIANGSVSVQGGGDGVINPEFVVTINLAYSSAIGANLNNSPAIHFASATCGNDILAAVPSPEPASLGLIGCGLLVAAGLRFRSKRHK